MGNGKTCAFILFYFIFLFPTYDEIGSNQPPLPFPPLPGPHTHPEIHVERKEDRVVAEATVPCVHSTSKIPIPSVDRILIFSHSLVTLAWFVGPRDSMVRYHRIPNRMS